MNILDSLCALHGISAAGVCEFCQLAPFMTPENHDRVTHILPNTSSVFVVLLPYFSTNDAGNVSVYARGRDYHVVLTDLLTDFCSSLEHEHSCHTVILVDNSPLPEVRAAYLSGVGKIGENGLLFDPVFGSYVFIGTILTDLPFSAQPAVHKFSKSTVSSDSVIDCLHCGKCRQVCPLGALQENAFVDCSLCLSALTQQGGELSESARHAVSAHPLVWGCDLCQQVCPQNRSVRHTDHPAFSNERIGTLTLADVENLTRKQFQEKYPDRAFTWRGPAPLRRNLRFKEDKS